MEDHFTFGFQVIGVESQNKGQYLGHNTFQLLETSALAPFYILLIGERSHQCVSFSLSNKYILKVNTRNTKKSCEICSKLTIKTAKRRHWPFSGVFIANFEYVFYCFCVDFEQLNVSGRLYSKYQNLFTKA